MRNFFQGGHGGSFLLTIPSISILDKNHYGPFSFAAMQHSGLNDSGGVSPYIISFPNPGWPFL